MNQEEKFYSYLQKLSAQTKNPIVESIMNGFKLVSGFSPLVENSDNIEIDNNTESEGEDAMIQSDASTESDVEPVVESETDEKLEAPSEAVSEPTKIVQSETVAPELLDKVTKLCTEVLGLYKHLTGSDFIKEDEKKESPEETPNDDEPVEPKEAIMEDVSLKERRATGDYTGTDYSKIFETLFAFLDEVENHVESMYRLNNVEDQDQIISQSIPHIDKILNTYKAEFQQLEEQHMDDVLPVMRTTIVNAVTKWIQILKKFDIKLNQHHEIPGYYGRYVVAKFITDVVTPAINYSDMIRGQATMNADKLQVNVKAVMDKINALIQSFDREIESDIKAKTAGKAYTKGSTQEQPQTISA